MKKLLLSAALLVSTFVASAQDYKPIAGDVTAEFGLTGGIGLTDLSLNNGAGQLRFRYFLADQLAVRVGLNLSAHTETNKFYGGPDGEDEGSQSIRNSDYVINLGVEKHLAGTDRLSTYVGADLLFIIAGASEKWENYDGAGYVDGYTLSLKGTNVAGTENGGMGYGLRVVAGADYYFVEKVYLGAEFGWGFTSFTNAGTKLEEDPATGTTTTTETNSTGGEFDLSPSIITGVRLGFRF